MTEAYKIHYNDGSGLLCGRDTCYTWVNGERNVSEVTCIVCQRSLVANAGGLVRYVPQHIKLVKGRRQMVRGHLISTRFSR